MRPEVVVIKELLWKKYLQILVKEKKYGNFQRRGKTNEFLRSVGNTSDKILDHDGVFGKHFISRKVGVVWD